MTEHFDDWAPDLWRKLQRRRRIRRAAKRGVVVVAVGAVLVAGGVVALRVTRGGGSGSATAAAAAEPTASPTATPSPTPKPHPDPFRHTPAAHFAIGPAGVVLPRAAAVGSFSATEVAQALARTRTLVVEQNLDLKVLAGNLDPYFAALSPTARHPVRQELMKSAANGLTYVTRLAPGVQLDPAGVHVRGGMTVTAVRDQGHDELIVKTNYIFAYALRKDHYTSLVSLHRKENFGFAHAWEAMPGDSGPWLADGGEGLLWWDASCKDNAKGLLGPMEGRGDAPTGSPFSDGPREDQKYDPSAPMDGASSC